MLFFLFLVDFLFACTELMLFTVAVNFQLTIFNIYIVADMARRITVVRSRLKRLVAHPDDQTNWAYRNNVPGKKKKWNENVKKTANLKKIFNRT